MNNLPIYPANTPPDNHRDITICDADGQQDAGFYAVNVRWYYRYVSDGLNEPVHDVACWQEAPGVTK